MSLSRQLRRAAERAQRKEEKKALKNSGTDLSAVRAADVSEAVEAGAPVCPRFFSSESTTPAQDPARPGPTGPRTPEGKAISCLNNLKHGLTGAFRVLEFESQSDFDAAHEALIAEHQPTTPTESELIRRMAEHAWLSRRAQVLQDKAITDGDDKRFSLYMRYQTTNDRGFRACLNDLFHLRKEQQASQRHFESQNRQAELHDARVRLANARSLHLEVDSEIRSRVDAPIPGYSSVPLDQIKELFKTAMLSLKAVPGKRAAA